MHSFLSPHTQIDLQKMPLGKLSKRQIQSAYALLTEVQQVTNRLLRFFFLLFLPCSITLGWIDCSFLQRRPCQMPCLTPTSWTCPIASTH